MVHRKIPNTSLNTSPEYTAITILNMGRLHLKIIRLQYSNPKRLMSRMKKKDNNQHLQFHVIIVPTLVYLWVCG